MLKRHYIWNIKKYTSKVVRQPRYWQEDNCKTKYIESITDSRAMQPNTTGITRALTYERIKLIISSPPEYELTNLITAKSFISMF